MSWPSALCALGVFLVILVLTKYVSLASVLGALTLPVFFFWLSAQHSAVIGVSVIVISLLVIVKHQKNIVRLKNGTESKFGSKSKPSNQASNA